MAGKKPSTPRKKPKTTRKKTPRTPPQKVSVMTNLTKILVGICLLIGMVASAGFLAKYLVIGQRSSVPVQTHRTTAKETEKPYHHKKSAFSKTYHHRGAPGTETPVFEIYPKVKTPPAPSTAPVLPPPPATAELPKVAIIIDDIGYDVPVSNQLLDLNAVLTFAILPYSPHLTEVAQAAHRKGIEIMLHLPMEPLEYPHVDPGPGALLADMTPDQLLSQLNRNLDAVPYIIGVNNHMGSRITGISTQMYQIFTILKKRNLFFIDSRTTAATLCRPSARLLRIPFGQRDVFLDHLQTKKAIRKQLWRLVKIAEQNGQAIGIGHPHLITCAILREELPLVKKKVKLVPASQVVHQLG